MEKEININRRKIVMYYGLIGLLPCLLLIPVFGVGLILAVIQAVLTVLFYPRLANALRYYYDNRVLHVEKGVLFKSRKTIPLDKITDMELVQGPILRILDMWVIKVQTASTASHMPEATLWGVVNPEQVRDEIMATKDAYTKLR